MLLIGFHLAQKSDSIRQRRTDYGWHFLTCHRIDLDAVQLSNDCGKYISFHYKMPVKMEIANINVSFRDDITGQLHMEVH